MSAAATGGDQLARSGRDRRCASPACASVRPPALRSTTHRSRLQRASGWSGSRQRLAVHPAILAPACRAYSRPPGRAAAPARRRPCGPRRCRPSPVTSRSGAGVASAQTAPIASGTTPSRRHRVRHSAIHSPPATISANAPPGIAGSAATDPGAAADVRAIHSSSSSDLPRQPPERRAQPDRIEQQRQRLQRHDDEGRQRDRDDIGDRAVEPGLVEMVQRDRHQRELRPPARSAAAIATPRASRRHPRLLARREPARGSADARAARRSRSPRRSSAGSSARPAPRARAAARPARPPRPAASVIASRPSASATSTSSAATHDRIVGTCAPVSSV